MREPPLSWFQSIKLRRCLTLVLIATVALENVQPGKSSETYSEPNGNADASNSADAVNSKASSTENNNGHAHHHWQPSTLHVATRDSSAHATAHVSLQGTSHTIRKVVRRMRPVSYKDRLEASYALPEPGHAEEFKARLERKCSRISSAGPPTRLVIAGMPNTGTNALTRYLNASLDVTVEGNPPDGIWKHQLPFHPQFEEFLAGECGKSEERTGVVFTVRNPGTWMLSQTTSHHDFGHRCFNSTSNGGLVCLFFGCGVVATPPCNRNSTREPLVWNFPTLLDLWAAYATHLPSLPTVAVVRYEDLLHDREEVLRRLSAHFGVGIKDAEKDEPDPLQHNSREFEANMEHSSTSGLKESQGRLYRFANFWNQYGVVPFGFSDKAADEVSSGSVQCEEGDERHLYFSGLNLEALGSASSRGVLDVPLRQHGYEVPSPDKADRAANACYNLIPTVDPSTISSHSAAVKRYRQENQQP